MKKNTEHKILKNSLWTSKLCKTMCHLHVSKIDLSWNYPNLMKWIVSRDDYFLMVLRDCPLQFYCLFPGTGLPALSEAGLPARRARASVLWCARAAVLWRARAARASTRPAQADRPADLPSPTARLTQVQHEARVCTNVSQNSFNIYTFMSLRKSLGFSFLIKQCTKSAPLALN